MESLITSVNVTLPILLLLGIGYILRRLNLIDENFISVGSQLNFRLFLPCSVFVSIYCKPFSMAEGGPAVIGGFVTYILTFGIGLLIVPHLTDDNAERGTMATVLFRSNYSYVGIPIVRTLCGEEGIYVASFVLAIIIPLANILTTIGFAIFSGHKADTRKVLIDILKNPCVVASVLGIVLMLAGCPQFPHAIHSTLSSLGAVCTPLALITIGGTLDFARLGKKKKLLIWGNVISLVVFPVIFTVAFILIGLRGPLLASLYVLVGCPVATIVFALSQVMGGDEELAAEQVASQCVLSIVTFFIGVYILRTCAFL